MVRFALQPRWIPWHLLCLFVTFLFVRLAMWQWRVAHSQLQLDWQNAAYAVQWIIFVGVLWWFWWKVMKDQRLIEQQRDEELVD